MSMRLVADISRLEPQKGMLVTFGMLERAGLMPADSVVLDAARAGLLSLCECSDPAHYQPRLVRAGNGKAYLGVALR